MKKNIAILIPNLNGGGAEKVASNLSFLLNDKLTNKYVIVYDSSLNVYSHGGHLIDMGIPANKNPIVKLYNFFNRINKLKKIKKAYNIDITISLLPGSNLVNILSKNNDKIIVSIRSYISKNSSGFYGKIFNFLTKFLYNKSDIIVSVSKILKNDLVKNYNLDKNKIKVIYNPYNLEKIEKMSNEKLDSKFEKIFDKPTIINVGRLSRPKGQWHLIRAFKKAKKTIPNIQLIILGQGEMENYLKKTVKKLGVNDCVHFLGFKDNPFKYIANSSIFVLSSIYEGFPNVLAEAMACKTPIISSDCKSGPREILAPNTDLNKSVNKIEYAKYGILTPELDDVLYDFDEELTYEEEILSQAIIEVINNKTLKIKYSNSGYKRVNDFNYDKILSLWENIIY